MPQLYQVNDQELAIFKKVEQTKNPNWFTDYYLRGENTGTWWSHGATSENWAKGYETLRLVWLGMNRPDSFTYANNQYKVVAFDDLEYPKFHHHHGFLFQPWQLDVYKAPQRIRVCVGGFGVGKSMGGIAGILERAATLPGYRALVLAPNSTMTGEIYTQALQLMYGTKYEERFLLKSTESPYPRLTIGNSYVGKNNVIQFFPIGDAIGIRKILTLTIDEAFIDQAEQLSGIPEIIRAVGSRMRGSYQGRERLGRMTFAANSDFNDELWELYDEAEKDPARVYSLSPKTWDNPFITDNQIAEIKKDVGNDEESIRVHMEGQRPVAGGEHFSASTLTKCKSPMLDDLMKQCLEKNVLDSVLERRDKVGIVSWQLPPRPNRSYLVVADPGYDNPPARNSPVIMVFDYTEFPEQPAHLWAFHWVYGNNNPEPWLAKYLEMVNLYRALSSNAFDSTGPQSGYERTFSHFEKMMPAAIDMGNNKKYGYLNVTKRLAARGLFKFPTISGVFQQLSRYKLPDTDLKQDIVAALLVASAWLESVFYSTMNEDAEEPDDKYNIDNRYQRGRYDRLGTGRGNHRGAS